MTTDHIPDAGKMMPTLELADLLEQNALMPLDDVAAAELRRLHAENKTLKAAQQECGFGAGCCYQAAKAETDEALLRQALDALNHVNVQDRVQIIAALRERLGETK